MRDWQVPGSNLMRHNSGCTMLTSSILEWNGRPVFPDFSWWYRFNYLMNSIIKLPHSSQNFSMIIIIISGLHHQLSHYFKPIYFTFIIQSKISFNRWQIWTFIHCILRIISSVLWICFTIDPCIFPFIWCIIKLISKYV